MSQRQLDDQHREVQDRNRANRPGDRGRGGSAAGVAPDSVRAVSPTLADRLARKEAERRRLHEEQRKRLEAQAKAA